MTKYGVYDTQDNCWLGDDHGPKLFGEEESRQANGLPAETLAKISAQLAEERLGYRAGRLRERAYDGSGNKLKDNVPTKMGALKALKRLEGESRHG